jgi:hypothetical protein
MIALSTIEDAIYTWIYGVLGSGVRVIWSDPNAPQPSRPYVNLSMSGLSIIGNDSPGNASNVGLRDILGDRDFLLTLDYYGDSALAYLDKVAQSISMQAPMDTLRAGDACAISCEPIIDNTALEAGGSMSVERATLDIHMRTSSAGTETIPLIKTVNVETEYPPSTYIGSIGITSP